MWGGFDGKVGSLPGEGTFEPSLISQRKVRAQWGKELTLPFLCRDPPVVCSLRTKPTLAPKEGLPIFGHSVAELTHYPPTPNFSSF